MVFFHNALLFAIPDSLQTLSRIQPRNLIFNETIKDTTLESLLKKNKRFDKDPTKLYLKIQDNADKHYFTRKLYGLFFRKQDLEIAGRVFEKTDATEKFIKYTGKKINSIEFIKLKAFGESIFDTTIQPTTWIEKSANNLHIRTANLVIRYNLLFNEGDLINPVDFAESEQLMRNLSFIEDARIVLYSSKDSSAVDVKVITKDTWSIGARFKFNNPQSSEFQLYDKNLGGFGLLLNGYLYRNTVNPNDVWGQKGELIIPNLLGTFVQGNLWIRKGQLYETYAVNFKRDFYASKVKYGGGASYINSSEPYIYKSIDSTSQINFTGYDYWIGKSFRVSRNNILKSPHNVVIAVRYLNRQYSQRPDVLNDYNYFFHNREYYLAGISLSQQNLYKANLIYSFGSTEDIPTGFRIHLTSGVEKGEFENRFYMGSELSSAEVGDWGYLFASARTGGFLSSLNQIQQITYNVRSTYFSNLFNIGKFEMRQFMKVDFTRGVRRYLGEGELIFLDRNYGIRGLTSPEMSGTTRLVFNLETIAFSPLFVFGFRFAYFAFCDFGFIGAASESLVGDQPFSGFGIGVRIRNENLVFNTFQLRLGYYPIIPSRADVAYWVISGQQRSTFENFRAKEPQILSFE